MTETLDLTYRELVNELNLRMRGRKGEWDIPTKILVQLWFAKRAKLPVGITRKLKEEAA